MRKSHPAQGPAPAAAGAARALFPMKLVLPGCSVPALRPQRLLLFKSLSVNPQSFLSPMLKHANSLMLHPCSRNMLWFLSARAPLWKRVTFHHMGKNLDRVFLQIWHLQNLLCHLSSKVSPRDCKAPSSETVT